MCRVLAYVGPEVPLKSLLLTPENSLLNQTLDPERHPQLQLAGWGFAAWSENFCDPEKPFVYRRPMAAFYDDNVPTVVPALQAHTMLAHVRAASYNAHVVLADENCHPFVFDGSPWTIAQNGFVPGWQVLQRELLPHCKDEYLTQMTGTTDTEFLSVLLLSVMESDSDEDVKRAVEEVVRLVADAREKLGEPGLTKMKMALVSPRRVIGINTGLGHQGETDPRGDWRELRKAEPGTDDLSLGMLLEPMYMLTGRHLQTEQGTYGFDECGDEDATSAIFASEPLTDETEDWSMLEFGQIVFLEKDGEGITRTVDDLKV
ncbi:class II glutamine amidotransferase [Nocardioides solisilvae]|uniref:class II glutamine amidotransferase n=1 Tax=Nocardioides solisilvae TaxID=1542435 RepID=UPI000D748799|nr:class II glutamine amidotransferase [Nocardioides solisilvae]